VFTAEYTHSNLIGLLILDSSAFWRSFTIGELEEFEYDVVSCEIYYYIFRQISQQVSYFVTFNTYHTNHIIFPYLDTSLWYYKCKIQFTPVVKY